MLLTNFKGPKKCLSRNQLKYGVRMRWQYNNLYENRSQDNLSVPLLQIDFAFNVIYLGIHVIWPSCAIRKCNTNFWFLRLIDGKNDEFKATKIVDLSAKWNFFLVNGKCHVTHNKTADSDLMCLQLNIYDSGERQMNIEQPSAFKGIYFGKLIFGIII